MIITAAEFCQAVKDNAARVTEYENGHDGTDGLCDCIGLIKGAISLCGGHMSSPGTNYTVREQTRELTNIYAAQLQPGMILFKSRAPGEENYKLPDKYRGTMGNLDFYHVGVVLRADPLQIIHCTDINGGIKYDGTYGNWKWAGKLYCVQYDPEQDDEEAEKMQYTIRSKNGKGANLRAGPSKNTALLITIPDGDTVEMLIRRNEYSKVQYQELVGYALTSLLHETGEEGAEPDPDAGGGIEDPDELIPVYFKRAELVLLFDAINDALIRAQD